MSPPAPDVVSTVLVIVGTRPEAIKVAPIVLAAQQNDSGLRLQIVATQQHGSQAIDVVAETRTHDATDGGESGVAAHVRCARDRGQAVGELNVVRRPMLRQQHGAQLGYLVIGELVHRLSV